MKKTIKQQIEKIVKAPVNITLDSYGCYIEVAHKDYFCSNYRVGTVGLDGISQTNKEKNCIGIVTDLSVGVDYENKGIGTLLTMLALHQLKTNGINKAILTDIKQPSTRKIAKKLGMKVVDTFKNPNTKHTVSIYETSTKKLANLGFGLEEVECQKHK